MASSNRKTILIVDDAPANLALVSGLLKDEYKTKVATNGQKALSLAMAEDQPDLILLDIMMPGMDGHEVCRQLKANPQTSNIPVIFLTGMTDAQEESRGFDLGAIDYIHKPFNAPIVQARVKTHLKLQDALRDAYEARKEADNLLSTILPEAAVQEIKDVGTVIPRRYEDVCVLFCDVVNFTSYCDAHNPEHVVSRLDALFQSFETIAAAHGLEKIKTIGDSFMAAADLLTKIDDPLATTLRCGLAMISTVIDEGLGWKVRVGVHVGPVVAGIVGQQRFQFDIWGDTVNVAARMAGAGAPDAVAVTGTTWELISGRFDGTALGAMDIKGKGSIPVYEILREKAPTSQAAEAL